jgi:glutamyl-tRNA synthetase
MISLGKMLKTKEKPKVQRQPALDLPGQVRVRIAPSPTGFLHVGTARTALFNCLFAKKFGGVFVLRIEDTDKERSEKKYEKDILEGLKWLGLLWDEGPEVGGGHGPYYQSERAEIYQQYIKKLLENDSAYFCYCTEEELKAQADNQITMGQAPKYSGRCRNLTETEKKRLEKEGRRPVIRFKMPTKKISFNDLIRGEIEVDSSLFGDIVIARDLNSPLYNLAAVIDDAQMHLTHIIRGEDHISNTPKQIMLLDELGFERPQYAHLPLILGSDRSKLSKRHGAISVQEYKKEGYLSQGLVNFMALLGWNPDTDQEVFNIKEMIEQFDLAKVQRAGAVFNIKKLQWINAQHLRGVSNDELSKLAEPFFKKEGIGVKEEQKIFKILELQKERARTLKELAETSKFFFKLPDYDNELLIWKESSKEEMKGNLDQIKERLGEVDEQDFFAMRLEESTDDFKEAKGTGEVYWPWRVAVSGLKGSPGPLEISEILGKKETLKRLEYAIKKLK